MRERGEEGGWARVRNPPPSRGFTGLFKNSVGGYDPKILIEL